ncbi:MAG: type III-A CRISPR-associated protein Csm2 [Candidatus Anstonellales archaeon]
MIGKITKIVADKKFFFIDNEYWCHYNDYEKNPELGDIVDYKTKIINGKKNAEEVKFIKKGTSLPIEYEQEIDDGYFNKEDRLKESLIIKYPQMLSVIFTSEPKKNKPSQIRKYYDYCKNLEGILKIKNNFNAILPDLYQLIPLTINAMNKDHISNTFKDFIEININLAVKSEKNFTEGFLPHFQALIGYYKI